MKNVAAPAFIPFHKFINRQLAKTEIERACLTAKMRESMASKKVSLAHLTLETSENALVALALGDALEGAQQEIAECQKVYEQTIALFN